MSTGNTPDNALRPMSVKLPKAVQMQIKSANEKAELIREFEKKTADGSHNVDEVPNPQSVPDKTPDTNAPAAAPVVQAEEPKPDKDAKYWEHRFKTAEGIFNAERTKLKTQIGELQGQMQELRNALRDTQRQIPQEVDLSKHFSKEEIEAYGPDLLKAVAKTATTTAKEIAERENQEELSRHIEPLKKELDAAQAQLRAKTEKMFWDNLTVRVPNWTQINDDPKFHSWLEKKDPLTGFMRQDLLTNAQTALDDERVVALFAAFLKDSPAPAPVVNPQVVPEPVGTTQTVAGGNNPSAPFLRRSEIKKFYSDKAIGKYRKAPQAAAEMEKRIRAATLAGTIIE